MARKKTAKRRSRRKTPIRLIPVAKGLIVGNAVTQGLFRTNLWEFTTGRIGGEFRPGGDGQKNITLPEILGFASSPWGMGVNATNSIGDVLKVNVMRPGALPLMIGTVLLTAPITKILTKALRPVITPINRTLKDSGVAL
jgi:hypothetical protein